MSEESIDNHTHNAESGLTADGLRNECPKSGALQLQDSQSRPAKSRCRRSVEIVVLSVVIVMVWALMANPTIFYHLPQNSQSSTDVLTDSCISENYTGGICREALLTRQNCITDGSATGDILIAMDSASSQFAKEEQTGLFIGGLSFLAPSPECMEAVVPFLCIYTFPLCDSGGRPYQLSSTECRAITDGVCAREFEMAAAFTEDDQLPQCQLLPETTIVCNATEDTLANTEDPELGINNSVSNSTERVCSEGFFTESTGLCTPECGVWEEFSHSFVVGVDTVLILSAVIGLLGSAVVLVFSCISYKRMFSFPSVFIVYSVIALGVLDLFLLIGYTDRTSLFCSSRALATSVENATPFCNLQGPVFYYASLLLVIFWLFHVLIISWGIVFPFHAKSFERRGYFKYIHIILAVIGLALPSASIGVIRAGGLTIAQFPPFLCVAMDSDANFYSYILPLSIMTAIGISLIAIILWVIVFKINRDGLGKAKVKLLIIFFYFFIISILSLTIYSVITQQIDDLVSELTSYLICESQGIQPGIICERDFFPEFRILQVASICLLNFYPVVTFVYVINVQDVKKLVKRFSNFSNIKTPLTSKQSI